MRVADQLTPFEKCLRSIPMENWQKSLDILETLLKNIAQNQREEKFRKIRYSVRNEETYAVQLIRGGCSKDEH